MKRPPDSASTATASRATFQGRRLASGVTMIPSRTRCVRTAIPATAIHGSVAGTDGSSSRAMWSHTNTPSHPAASASTASSTSSPGSAYSRALGSPMA